jgi:hypothetical protein
MDVVGLTLMLADSWFIKELWGSSLWFYPQNPLDLVLKQIWVEVDQHCLIQCLKN